MSPTTNTTYFAKARNTTTGCVSAACASVTVTVNNLPNTPTLGTVSAICSGSSATLTGSAGPGETIDWFVGSCGGYARRLRPLHLRQPHNNNHLLRPRP